MTTVEYSRSHRWSMIGCAAFFAAMAAANAILLPLDDDVAKKPLGIAFLVGFWLCWLLASLYGVFESCVVRFVHSKDSVSRTGPLGVRKIAFADVVSLQWRGMSRTASVKLKTPDQRLALPLLQLSRADGLGLIKCIHENVPETLQKNWPEFCARVALPWRKSLDQSEPSEDDIADQRQIRKRVDARFAALAVIFLLIGGWYWWLTNDPKAWLGLGLLTFFWVPIRSVETHKSSETRQLDRDITPYTILTAICWALAGLGCLLTVVFDWPGWVLAATCAVAFAGYVFALIKISRAQQSALRTWSENAVVDWQSPPSESRLSNT